MLPRKKPKTAETEEERQEATNHVLLPYRAVGAVTGTPTPAVVTAGKDTFALCAVGRTFHEYNLAKLQLIHVSPALPKKIRAVAKSGTLNVAAARGDIYCFKTRRLIWTSTHSPHAKVIQLIARNDVLLSLGTDVTVKVWRLSSGELLHEFALSHDSTPTVMCTVVNYRNKVVLGTQQGCLELWNFNTGTLVHKFPSFGSPVTALAVPPAEDCVAVGLTDGRVVLFNLPYGEELSTFRHSSQSSRNVAVTSISFRTDGPQTMCSGTIAGEVAVWNLHKKKLEGLLTANLQADTPDDVFERPHSGRVTLLHFLPSEPVLLSAGEDNSLRMYVFDKLQGTGKLLRERRGHYAPCTGAQFFDEKVLLTYGSDRTFRASHVFSDLFNREISQGSVLKEARKRSVQTSELKLPPVSCLASNTNRAHDWSAAVTGHKGSSILRLWRLDNFVVDSKKGAPLEVGTGGLGSPDRRDREAEVTAVAVTPCGNFAAVGYSTGRVHCFNIQSHLLVGSYADESLEFNRAHEGRVVGLYPLVDGGELLSVGVDNDLRLWKFPPPAADVDTSALEAKIDGSLTGARQKAGKPGAKGAKPAAAKTEHDDGLLFRMVMDKAPVACGFMPSNNFLAVADASHGITVYDVAPLHLDAGIEEKVKANVHRIRRSCAVVQAKAVRKFTGHQNTVRCLAFTSDSRLLFSSSLDGILCAWDLPTHRLVDVVSFPAPVTSLTVHPSDYFIATTHTNDQNVYLWTNKVKYGHIPKPWDVQVLGEIAGNAHDSKRKRSEGLAEAIEARIGSNNSLFVMPEVAIDGVLEDEFDDEDEEARLDAHDKEAQDLLDTSATVSALETRLVELSEKDTPGCIEFSRGPRTKWSSLVALDQIKKRNAPIAPPKKIDAPFFLPSANATPSTADSSGSRLLSSLKATDTQATPFVQLLLKQDYAAALDLLEQKPNNEVDLEFRSLVDTYSLAFGESDEDAVSESSKQNLNAVISFFEHHLARRSRFEYLQATLSLFLRYTGLIAARDPEANKRLTRLHELEVENADLLSSLADSSVALIRHFVAAV
ncbi:U3 small nucleolar RNA-associated protein 21-like protein [Diplonema papillatum]|nr:U3 small nucleolar RNA-associated protein 21-like protein [Diplonema papillatum]